MDNLFSRKPLIPLHKAVQCPPHTNLHDLPTTSGGWRCFSSHMRRREIFWSWSISIIRESSTGRIYA